MTWKETLEKIQAGEETDCGADRDSGGLFEESGTGGAVRGQWSGQPGGQPV